MGFNSGFKGLNDNDQFTNAFRSDHFAHKEVVKICKLLCDADNNFYWAGFADILQRWERSEICKYGRV